MPPDQGPYQPVVDPYAFLNETKKPRSLSFGSLKGLSFRGKIGSALVGLVILVILLFGLKSILGGTHGVNMASLYYVLGQEQELINLSTTGGQQASVSQSYLNFSATTLASATTDQQKMIDLLKLNGIGASAKSFVLQPSADAQLKQAEQNSNFDPVYSTVMLAQLKLYQSDLSSAYSLNKSAVLKSYLKTDYNNTVLLLKMLGSSYG
ncbi:MAG: hypothetical protein ACREF7_01535 [Candidatus Saccharimonadales bacterium]